MRGAIRSDRRLYVDDPPTRIFEHGEVGGRFLLVGIDGTITPDLVERFGLSVRGGVVRYDGAPDLPDLPEAEAKELGAAENKMLGAQEDKTMRIGGSSAVRDDGSGEQKAEASEEAVVDDSGRNEAGSEEATDEAPEVEPWTKQQSPETYLKRYPNGPNAEHARQVLSAAADGS